MVMPLDSTIDAAKKGSADLLILSMLEAEALHGYDIAGRIEMRSGGGTLRFTLASLYATLYRLEERELIRGDGLSAPVSGAAVTTASRPRDERR